MQPRLMDLAENHVHAKQTAVNPMSFKVKAVALVVNIIPVIIRKLSSCFQITFPHQIFHISTDISVKVIILKKILLKDS